MATKEEVIEVLRDCYDPEIPVNVVDLGLVYSVDNEGEKVNVRMTLTAPGCPSSGEMGEEIKWKLLELPGVKDAQVEFVWDPPWSPEKMSEEARLMLGF